MMFYIVCGIYFFINLMYLPLHND